MNNLLTPPPEHELRSITRDRQRDELLAIVAHESHEGTTRRPYVPLAAAAAVVAVVAGLAVGVPALRGDKTQPPVAGGESATSEPVQVLDALATKLTWSACMMGIKEDPRLPEPVLPYTGGKAFEYKKVPAPGAPHRWFFTATGSYGSSLVCALDVKGKVIERWPAAGSKSLGNFLFAPADLRGSSSGLYTQPVAKITLQKPGGPLVEAQLVDGFWFAPLEPAAKATVRAYDKAGKLIYDSAKQGPSPDDCYANPDGTKVVKVGKAPNPDPASCHKTLPWSYLPR